MKWKSLPYYTLTVAIIVAVVLALAWQQQSEDWTIVRNWVVAFGAYIGGLLTAATTSIAGIRQAKTAKNVSNSNILLQTRESRARATRAIRDFQAIRREIAAHRSVWLVEASQTITLNSFVDIFEMRNVRLKNVFKQEKFQEFEREFGSTIDHNIGDLLARIERAIIAANAIIEREKADGNNHIRPEQRNVLNEVMAKAYDYAGRYLDECGRAAHTYLDEIKRMADGEV